MGKWQTLVEEQPSSGWAEKIKQPPVEETLNLSWRAALVEGFSNIPSSAWQTARDMVEPIFSPIETGKAIGRMTAGAAQKVYPGEQKYEADFDAVVNFFKGRYGSVDNFKRTVAQDPVGVSVDVASLFTGAGGAVRGVGAVGKMNKVSKVGQVASKVGASLEPISVARRVAALPFKLVPEKVPINWYQSAVKFGTTLTPAERKAITKTAISAKNQIMPTTKGLIRLRKLINEYNVEIARLVEKHAKQGTTIGIAELHRGLEKVKNQMRRVTHTPLSVEKAFKVMKDEWRDMLRDGPFKSPIEVQRVKQKIYKDLSTHYEQVKSSPAKVEMQQMLARNAKEILEGIIPEIKLLNKNDAALLNLEKSLASKANRISNRDIISIGIPVKMGTASGIGYMFGDATGAAVGSALGLALGIFDVPQVKAKIALVVQRLREQGITVKPSTAALKLGLYQAGRDL